MPNLVKLASGSEYLLQGNEAIARGALEAGVQYCAAYPGTPSTEILTNLAAMAKEAGLHAEWSTNEKVATEAALAAAYTGLRTISSMKNAGLNVAMDTLQHINLATLGDQKGAMVVVVADDPQSHASGDEEDTRWAAQMANAPLMEPASFQEALDMTKALFELSEEFSIFGYLRGYTRLAHSRGNVKVGDYKKAEKKAWFDRSKMFTPYIAPPKRAALIKKMAEIRERFEDSPFNTYQGPDKPELLIICSGSGLSCSLDAIEELGLASRVGILKLGTLWPFPSRTVVSHVQKAGKTLVVEESDPFVETHVKEAVADARLSSAPEILGKGSGHQDYVGENNPDRVIAALCRIFGLEYHARDPEYQARMDDVIGKMVVTRGLAWCPGCPHRASFYALGNAIKRDGRDAVIASDIGCYTMDAFPAGTQITNMLHCMGGGFAEAGGLGQLGQFGFTQPAIGVCGDSTFFHGALPALINAVYNKSNVTYIVLDNAITAMTGFQPHAASGRTATQDVTTQIDIEALCKTVGCRVEVEDPFDTKATTAKIMELLKDDGGVKVLILRRKCELLRMRQDKKHLYKVYVDTEKCKGDKCGFCYRILRCPGVAYDSETGKAKIQPALCAECGLCADLCPSKAIVKEERA
ncbi:MAG: indolepyruvate ferredoxin oxidoreductase [Dehalococcoidia bacterium]|nr:indolepyruvate ferredoxin oxidoreductase [Dehalococcoidia bacterium]